MAARSRRRRRRTQAARRRATRPPRAAVQPQAAQVRAVRVRQVERRLAERPARRLGAARTRSSSRPATRRPRGRFRRRAAALRCRPAPSIVKSEAVGATTDCTTRVKAIRRPSGENEGMASNGPVRQLPRCAAARRDRHQPHPVACPSRAGSARRRGSGRRAPRRGSRVAAERLPRRRDRQPPQAAAVGANGVEARQVAAQAAQVAPEGDPARRGRAARAGRRAHEERCEGRQEQTLHQPSLR